MEPNAPSRLETAAPTVPARPTPPQPTAQTPDAMPAPDALARDRLYLPLQALGVVVPEAIYADAAGLRRGSDRSRTALLGATGLHQHQRVHDADELEDGPHQELGLYDGRRVVFQEGVFERDGRRRRRPPRPKAPRPAAADAAGASEEDADETGLLGEGLADVIRIVQAIDAAHRRHASPPPPRIVSPELTLGLRRLVLTAATPTARRAVLAAAPRLALTAGPSA